MERASGATKWYVGGVVAWALASLALAAYIGAVNVFEGMAGSTPRRYCVVSELSVDREWFPRRRAGEVGPEADPYSGCFVPEYVVCVDRDSYDVNAWDDPDPRTVEAVPCPSPDPTTEPADREGSTYCVVSRSSRRARSDLPAGEIVRADDGGCLDSESVVCGYFMPAAAERWTYGPDKTFAFESAQCPG